MEFVKYKLLNLKDPLLTKVSFEVPLRGSGGLSGLEFVNLENSKLKILKLSKMVLNGEKFVKV